MENSSQFPDPGGNDSDWATFSGVCHFYDFANINGYLFIFITIISIIGNTLLIFLLVTQKNQNFVPRFLILNLACSDLIFTASLPFWAYYHIHHWMFGDILCKFMIAVYFVGMYSSMFILTAMTVDRFVTVVLNKWPNNSVRKKCGVGACVAAWLISIAVSGYDASKIEVENDYYCEKYSDDELGNYFQVSFLFFLPFLVIVFCHCSIMRKVFQATNRQRYKATSIVFCVVAAYFICWGPYNILLLIKSLYQPNKCETIAPLEFAYNVCRILTFSHCCVNPLLCLLSQKLRRHLLSLLTCETLRLNNWNRLTEQNGSGVQTVRLSTAQPPAVGLELQPG